VCGGGVGWLISSRVCAFFLGLVWSDFFYLFILFFRFGLVVVVVV